MTLLFRCGHQGRYREGSEPVCHCGERRVARCFAPAPRIVGKASGPLVETKDVEPYAGSLLPGDVAPLKLKVQESAHDE